MSELKARVSDAMKEAMRAKDKDRLGVIRMFQAALKQIEVDERIELDDARVLAVLEKQIKQRRESAKAFEEAGRPELVEKELAEASVLQEFLPAQLTDAELDQLITESIAATGATSGRDMGKVINDLRPKVTGKTDMGALSQKVKARLG